MTPEMLAQRLAPHAVAALVVLAATLLVATAVGWRLVQRLGPELWRLAARGCEVVARRPEVRAVRGVPVLGPLLDRTLTVGRWLGVYAVLAFGVAVAGLAAFFEIADELGGHEELARFDAALAQALGRHLDRRVLLVVARITRLGDFEVLAAVATVVAVALLARRRWLTAAAWIGATAGGAALTAVLKALIARERPRWDSSLVVADGWSFPSGHAAGVVVVYGLLGYLLILSTPRAWHVPIVTAVVSVAVFVGASRVLLQVHYLSDVLGGWATGGAWVALCVAGFEAARWRARGRP